MRHDEDVRHGLDDLEASVPQVIEEAIRICEVPAPPFQEGRRAEYVQRRMAELGLGRPGTDAEGNVVTELPGQPGSHTVIITAHLDTVFGPETEIRVRRDGQRLYGPGIGDNSMALAGLLWLGRVLKNLPNRGTLLLAANVGEEGLGNLRGARALWEQFGAVANAWIILEGGMFNRATAVGVCSRRLRVTYTTLGGHSWNDFGRPSAIHALGRLIDQIAQINVPADPRTTYNVGIIEGGRTVNTIASSAALILDMRSEDQEALDQLDQVARGLVNAVADASDVESAIEVVGERKGGRLPVDHPIRRLVDDAAEAIGVPVRWKAASTDANVPLCHGAAAVCLGLAAGDNLHTTDEVLDVGVLPKGLQQTFLVAASLLRKG